VDQFVLERIDFFLQFLSELISHAWGTALKIINLLGICRV
jgi:hypothetical protein